MRFKLRNTIIFLVIICSTGVLVDCSENEKEQQANIRSVKTMVVNELAQEQVRRIPGVVEAANTADLSFQIAGQIQKINVSLGDKVAKGSIIALLDATPYELNVRSADAGLTRAAAYLMSKKQNYEAKKSLVRNSVVSQQEATIALAEYNQAQAEVNVAKVKLELAQRDLSNTKLLAPFNGYVAEKNTHEYAEVTAGQVIFKLQSDEGLEVAIRLPDTLINRVKLEDIVTVTLPEISGQKITATVSEIGSVATAAHSFPLKVSLLKPPADIRVGMAAEVTFHFKHTDNSDVYLIPINAVLPGDRQMQGYVYTYDAKTSLVSKRIVMFRNIHDNDVEVYKGLKAGDVIVVAGAVFLHDGQKVRLLKD